MQGQEQGTESRDITANTKQTPWVPRYFRNR